MNTFLSLKIGEKDSDNELVTALHYTGPDYVIYETKTRVKWQTTKTDFFEVFLIIDAKIVRHYGIASGNKNLEKIARQTYIGALGLSTGQKSDEANSLLISTESRLLQLKSQYGRIYYLFSCLAIVLISLLTTAIVSALGNSSEVLYFSSIISCGALGSFLSIMLNLNNLNVDTDTSWEINFVSGASRILIGMTGAVFTYFLIKADVIFGFVIRSNSSYALFAICMVAGFSETLVPNILKKVENQE